LSPSRARGAILAWPCLWGDDLMRILRLLSDEGKHRSGISWLILAVIFVIGLPLRMQNMGLAGYVSDDGWWHYRQIKQVVDYGHRLNPDPYEFVTLGRDLTYPPVFHYALGWAYKLLGRPAGLSLIEFTHYFNLAEYLAYVLLVYFICRTISASSMWSLLGPLSVAVSYGMIIRARSGELMAFVLADIFALAGLGIFLSLRNASLENKRRYIAKMSLGGVLLGLSLLTWQGAFLVWLPPALFLIAVLAWQGRALSRRPALAPGAVALMVIFGLAVIWYLPIILRYGINPHSREMSWFMKMTVLHKTMPWRFYFLSCGAAILAVPFVLFRIMRYDVVARMFLVFWAVQGLVAALSGWRGYLAVAPIITSVMLGICVKKTR
ncbi:MAG: hypothetical protein ACE5GG_02255, partial [Candidatus Omnitrophota bacterium]